VITSLKNPRVAEALKLRKRGLREDRSQFLVEGPQAVGEALKSSSGLGTLFHTPDARLHPHVPLARESGVEVVEVDEEVVRALTSTVTPQGLVGVAPYLDVALDELPERLGLAAVLYSVRDPGNAGAVLRSADAAGADGAVFTSASVDVYNPKTVRSSAGSLFHLPIVRDVELAEAIDALRDRGLSVYAASADGDEDLYSLDLSAPSAFVFGNEAWGLPAEIRDLADTTARIPLAERAESLNLAAAATLFLFEAVRQRRRAGTSLAAVVSGAAHDIRSPLTAVSGAASTLLKRWRATTDEQREQLLAAMGNDAARMNETLRELVDAARIVEGRLEVSPERVDVPELVQGLTEKLSRDQDQPEIELEVGPAVMFADRERIVTSMRAMVRAVGWWGREGPVRIGARSGVDTTVVEVRRGGADVASGDAPALFGAGQPGPGAGVKLGLFVARGVAEAHGGSLVAEIGGELRLTMTLPAP
jgi:RNA methyltransferase, TrmH family